MSWKSPPGDTILDCLAERQLTQAWLAETLGLGFQDQKDLIRGVLPIDAPLAEKLANALGATPAFWINRDIQYRIKCLEEQLILTKEESDFIKPVSQGRGLKCYGFQDRYQTDCTIQDSSLAGEDAIWFGTDGKVEILHRDGTGWHDYPFPTDAEVCVHSRMHLTRKMAEELIPYLQHFVDCGKLP